VLEVSSHKGNFFKVSDPRERQPLTNLVALIRDGLFLFLLLVHQVSIFLIIEVKIRF